MNDHLNLHPPLLYHCLACLIQAQVLKSKSTPLRLRQQGQHCHCWLCHRNFSPCRKMSSSWQRQRQRQGQRQRQIKRHRKKYCVITISRLLFRIYALFVAGYTDCGLNLEVFLGGGVQKRASSKTSRSQRRVTASSLWLLGASVLLLLLVLVCKVLDRVPIKWVGEPD